MFRNLFDLAYERNTDEALVFYFFYLIFTYFIAGLFYSLAGVFHSDLLGYTCLALTFFVPCVFYTFLSISIMLQKKNINSLYLVINTIAITFIIPLALGICIGFGFLGYNQGILNGIGIIFVDYFFCGTLIGCIPVTLLTMKEDNSSKKEVQQMEQEKLEHELWIDKQLMLERSARIQQEKIENNTNDN